MIVPYSVNPSKEQKYRMHLNNLNRKAKHLSTRMNLFLKDLEKDKDIKEADKEAIRNKIFGCLSPSSINFS